VERRVGNFSQCRLFENTPKWVEIVYILYILTPFFTSFCRADPFGMIAKSTLTSNLKTVNKVL
jgi:hypothetical protein